MADDESIREDVDDSEVENEVVYEPTAIRGMGTEKEENIRFQTYTQLKQYPPGHKRHNNQETFVEVMEQPRVSIKTGFQCIASSGRVLFAANGPDIHSFDILGKTHLSTWKYPKDKNFPKIPEALTTVHDPNLPSWAFQPDELKGLKPKNGTENDGPTAKRRKLNKQNRQRVSDEKTDVTESQANDTNAEATKGASSEGEISKEDQLPTRPTNPELWHSGIADEEEGKPEPLAKNGKGLDVGNAKYEKSSVRAPDNKPEGWVVNDAENWRRPEFRPGRRLEWKHQPSTATPDIPLVQCMSVTADGKHVVAVTGSDKTIWVYEHDGNGQLTLLSQRTMPKRPNAIAFANKDRTILCADKFGDVYALPLIERKDILLKISPALLSRSATPAAAKPFHSQANEKTVHSKRNLAALENQKKQLEKEGSSTPKDGVNPKKDPAGDFYHKLILGHVSMLTDLAVGRVQAVDPKSGRTFHKELIITADRDEHIRVSRGMPQSHVIENFLLGHKEFVSRIHVPQRYPHILVSGGGDSYIYVWDYTTGHLLSRQEMRPSVVKKLDADADTDEEPPLAVSGITSYYDAAIGQTRVFVICENFPKLFVFALDEEQMLHPSTDPAVVKVPGHMALAGNPLAITTFCTDTSRGIIVTYDPWTAGREIYEESHAPMIQVLIPNGIVSAQTQEIAVPEECSEEIAFTFRGDWEKALYTIEPLRKNCFDRDILVKDEGGYWGAKPSTG